MRSISRPRIFFEESLEADERERRGPCGRFNDQIDVGVGTCLMTSDGPEDRQPRVSVISGKGFEDRRGGLEQDLGVDTVEFGGGLELLADGRLGDVEGTGDLALGHSGGHHGPQCKDATQPRDVLGTPGLAVLGQQSHKAILSAVRQRPRLYHRLLCDGV